MNVRNSLLAVAVALGCLFGAGTATASAVTTDAATVKPACGIHYKLTQDRNGRWYCKWAPQPRHNRHDKERRAAN